MPDRRIRRHDMKHDEFIDFMSRATLALEDRWQQIAILGGGALAIVLIALGVFTWMGRSRQASAEQLAVAESLLRAPVRTAGARPEDPASPSFPSARARDEAALAALDRLAPGGRGGALANYYRGVALMRLGRVAEAQEALEAAVQRADDPLVKGLAGHTIATLQAESGNLAGAEQRLKELADSAVAGYPKDLLLYDLSRVQALQGRAKDSEETLARIRREFPDSPTVRGEPTAPPSQG